MAPKKEAGTTVKYYINDEDLFWILYSCMYLKLIMVIVIEWSTKSGLIFLDVTNYVNGVKYSISFNSLRILRITRALIVRFMKRCSDTAPH